MKLKTINYSYDITENQDDHDPRKNCNLTTLYCKHRNYTLGDHQIDDDFDSYKEMEKSIIDDQDIVLAEPLFFFNHSRIGLERSKSCPWDSGLVGVLLVTKENAIKILGTDYTEQQLQNIINEEIKEYNKYLNGENYYYTYKIYNKDYSYISDYYYCKDEAEKACLAEITRLNKEAEHHNSLVDNLKQETFIFIQQLENTNLKKFLQDNLQLS